MSPFFPNRVTQTNLEMKIIFGRVVVFLNYLSRFLLNLMKLTKVLLKTILEILRSVEHGGIKRQDTEEISPYLQSFFYPYQFERMIG